MIGKTYDIRSKLVHTGSVDESKPVSIATESVTSAQLVQAAVLLVALLIKVVIRDGAIPNWPEFDVS